MSAPLSHVRSIHTARRQRGLRALAGALLAVALLGSVTGCGSASSGSAATATQDGTLDVQGFAERVSKSGTVVLDVRTPAEFAEGHLKDAVNLDVESGEFDARLKGLDKTARYAVYCRSGNRSAVALGRMRDAGFTDVAHLEGGITAWVSQGGPTVR